jgi:Cdc6-like AAA superfamily ATPase
LAFADKVKGYSPGMTDLILPSPFFTGREDILAALANYFCFDSSTSTIFHQRKIFVLYGLGGAGKTQIALQFLQKFKKRYKKRLLSD